MFAGSDCDLDAKCFSSVSFNREVDDTGPYKNFVANLHLEGGMDICFFSPVRKSKIPNPNAAKSTTLASVSYAGDSSRH